MTRLKGKKVKKVNSKARVFCLFLAVIFILSQSNNVQIVNAAGKVYVDRKGGLNTNSGESKEDAVRSLRKAKELLKGKGTICIKIDGKWIALDVEVVKGGKKSKNETEETKMEKPTVEEKPNVGNALGHSAVEEQPIANDEPNVGNALGHSAEEQPTPEQPTVAEEQNEITDQARNDDDELKAADEPNVGNALGHSTEEQNEIADQVRNDDDEPKAADEPNVGNALGHSTEEQNEIADQARNDDDEPKAADEPNVGDGHDHSAVEEDPKANEAPNVGNALGHSVDDEPKVDEDPNVGNTLGHSTEEQNEIADQLRNDDGETKVEEPTPEQPTPEQPDVDNLNRIVNRMTVMVEGPSDTDNVEAATQAYEALDEEAKSKVPPTVYKRLRAAQIVASSGMRTVSAPVEIVGNTGDVYDQSGTQSGNTSSGGNSNNNSNNSNSGNNNSGSDNKNTGGDKNTTADRSVGAKTGDNNNILTMALIGAAAGAVVGGLLGWVFLKKKKKDKDDEDKESKRP